MIKVVSESLAGRVGFIDLAGFDLAEVGTAKADQLWLRGGFPLATQLISARSKLLGLMESLQNR